MIQHSASSAASRQRVLHITEKIILFTLVVYALFAPHSIAITEGSALLGFTAWVVQLAVSRKVRPKRTPVDIVLFGFFACCVVSAFTSYDPLVSIKGLRSQAFFLAFYFVSTKVRDLRFANLLAFALIGSCLINVGYSAVQLGIGRGLRINSIAEDGPFDNVGLKVGDVIVAADDKPVKTIDDLPPIIEAQRGPLHIRYLDGEAVGETAILRSAFRRAGGSGVDRLGITTSPGRSFRITGFYSHYETYAEVLQLIAALAVGLLIAHPRRRSPRAIFLGASIVLIVAALIMTSTRATLVGLAIGVFVMALASSRPRTMALALLAILILTPIALLVLQHFRHVPLIDLGEGSTAWRLEVWPEGFRLIKDNPLFGIGKGSEAKLKDSLGLFDRGRLPPGHFHSTPIQIGVWWGLIALVFYYSFMTIFFIEAWRLTKRLRNEGKTEAWGITLGGMGAFVAFNVASMAHLNFGDGEVFMAFWLLTGLVFAVRRITLEQAGTQPQERIELPRAREGSPRSQPQSQEAVSESSARAAGARPS